jgi:hypothetical protein
MPLFREKRESEQPSEQVAPVPPPQPGVHLLYEGPILATWFVLYRLEQEVERSKRYGSCLSILVAEVQLIADERVFQAQRLAAAEASHRSARAVDLVGWLDDRRIIVVLPEADAASARFAASRLRDEIWILSHSQGNQKWDITMVDDLSEIEALLEHASDQDQAAAAA